MIHPARLRPTEADELRGEASEAGSSLGRRPITGFSEPVGITVEPDLLHAGLDSSKYAKPAAGISA